MNKLASAVLIAFALLTPINAFSAQNELSAPAGEALLIVSGDISQTNVGATAVFDRDMLVEMGATEITTATIWTEGVQTFAGVSKTKQTSSPAKLQR